MSSPSKQILPYKCFVLFQLSAIFSDETGVEYVKKEGLHRNKSKMQLMQEVFGNRKFDGGIS